MRGLLGKVALAIGSVLVAGALIEGVLRLAGFEPERPVNPLFSWTGDQGELWRLTPGSRWRTRDGGHEVRVNSHGLRDREIGPKRPGSHRILVLGDSVTFGHGQPIESSFVRELERLLSSHGADVEVLNGGVPGWSTYQERLFYEQYGEALSPDLVLSAFVLNDVKEIHQGLIELSAGSGLALIRWVGWLSERSSAVAALKRIYANLFEPQEREIRAAEELVRRFRSPEVQHAMDLTIEEFRRLAYLARERGDGFGIVLFPFRFQLRGQNLDAPQRRITEFAAENGIAVFDMLPVLGSYDIADVLMDHGHLTAHGHRIAARAIAGWLEDESLLPHANASEKVESAARGTSSR